MSYLLFFGLIPPVILLIANMIFTILITFIAFVCLHIYAKKDRPIEENVMKTA